MYPAGDRVALGTDANTTIIARRLNDHAADTCKAVAAARPLGRLYTLPGILRSGWKAKMRLILCKYFSINGERMAV